MVASFYGDADIVKILLNNGADKEVNIQRQRFSHGTALMDAAYAGHIDVVELLLNKGARRGVDLKNIYGKTALALAAQNGHMDIVELLLKNGASEVDYTTMVSSLKTCHMTIFGKLLLRKLGYKDA